MSLTVSNQSPPAGGLRRRDVTASLLVLALPIIGMTISRMLMGFIDFAMVSQLGTTAQAAISPATTFVFVISCLGMGIANGVQTFVSQADGRGAPHLAGGYTWQSIYVAAAVGLLSFPLAATVETWFGWIAALGQHGPELMALEVEYIRIALWSIAPSIVCIGLNGFFNGVQKPNIALVAVIASLVVNAFGNWLLIFGNWGFPEMGVAGAAVATVIGWLVRAGVMFVAMLLPSFHERFETRTSWRYDGRKMRELMRIGIPTSVQWLVDIGAWLVFMMIIVPPLGATVLAASNVGLQYMHLSFMPAVGLGIALSSKVGFAIGEKRPEEAELYTSVAARLMIAYMAAVGVLFFAARHGLMWLFNADPAVIEAGAAVLIWAAIFQAFDAMCITYMNALRGAGDTFWPAVMTFVCCWVIFVGGGLAATAVYPQFGLNGPWAMTTLYITVLGLLLWRRWTGGRWRSIDLSDRPEECLPAEACGEIEAGVPDPGVVVPGGPAPDFAAAEPDR